MHTDRTQLIATLAQTPPAIARLTSALTDAELDFHPGEQEWSIREILAHLVDDEMFIMRTRLERMVKEEHPTLPSHDEKHWYSQRNTSRDALNELLHDLAVQRAASLNILTFLQDSAWERTAFHPEHGDITAQGWVEQWVAHDQTHIQQIERAIPQ